MVETLEIPATVQPIIAARIDRLGDTEKRVLQIAAVIGKQFPEPLLNQISALPESDFAAALIALQDGEFLRVETLFPEVEYAFKHPLTQEVAYDSQLQSIALAHTRGGRTGAHECCTARSWASVRR